MQSEPLSKIPSAADFAQRIQEISHDLLAVARDLASALDLNPDLAAELEAHGVNRQLIRRLERLGRGQIHESLVFTTTPGGVRLLTVPLSEQKLALTNGVEVLEDDELTTRNIPIHELNNRQAKQVISAGNIRTLAEQRTWLREQKKKSAPVERDADYKVLKDCVVTSRPGKWSKQLILQWLTEMN